MTQRHDVDELLSADRELTHEELIVLQKKAATERRSLKRLLRRKARQAYSVADSGDLATCITEHLSDVDASDMVIADVYHCPACGRLLKDRQNRTASILLLERNRVRELWLDVEQAGDEDFEHKLARFRRALGITG